MDRPSPELVNCPHCGAINPVIEDACGSCGQPLAIFIGPRPKVRTFTAGRWDVVDRGLLDLFRGHAGGPAPGIVVPRARAARRTCEQSLSDRRKEAGCEGHVEWDECLGVFWLSVGVDDRDRGSGHARNVRRQSWSLNPRCPDDQGLHSHTRSSLAVRLPRRRPSPASSSRGNSGPAGIDSRLRTPGSGSRNPRRAPPRGRRSCCKYRGILAPRSASKCRR